LWWLTWVLLAFVFAAIMAIIVYDDALDRLLLRVGIPFGALLLLVATGLIFLVSVYMLRRWRIAQVKERATFNATIRLAQDESGLRFATEEIEYYLKWRGISQILLDHDGVIVSHGNLFFLVPDRAFANPDERLGFIHDVYGRLGERARAISEKHVGAALKADVASPAAT
jgi:hypothetical protein